jgi:hypothetical protein
MLSAAVAAACATAAAAAAAAAAGCAPCRRDALVHAWRRVPFSQLIRGVPANTKAITVEVAKP